MKNSKNDEYSKILFQEILNKIKSGEWKIPSTPISLDVPNNISEEDLNLLNGMSGSGIIPKIVID